MNLKSNYYTLTISVRRITNVLRVDIIMGNILIQYKKQIYKCLKLHLYIHLIYLYG